MPADPVAGPSDRTPRPSPALPFAIVFPGQGAAAPELGRPWVEHPAWSVVEQAEAVLDRPLARLLLEADEGELAATRASQLAVLLHSLVVWEALRPDLPSAPLAFAGHSLGQVTALLAAGALDRPDGFRLAAARADASQDSADANPGRMAALVGATPEQATAACDGVEGAWIANDNAPGQIVIAGTPDGIEAAGEQARQQGVRRVMALDVGHAFHTPLLADAADALRPVLAETAFRAPSSPIVTNTDARPHSTGDGWPELLTRHLVEPVRWRESQGVLADLGAAALVEVGPGNVLAGLAKRAVPDLTVVGVHVPDDLAPALAALHAALEPAS
jgi:[acyl-carrier-protein] S-malonyltransferase